MSKEEIIRPNKKRWVLAIVITVIVAPFLNEYFFNYSMNVAEKLLRCFGRECSRCPKSCFELYGAGYIASVFFMPISLVMISLPAVCAFSVIFSKLYYPFWQRSSWVWWFLLGGVIGFIAARVSYEIWDLNASRDILRNGLLSGAFGALIFRNFLLRK